jgi:hypothetical protein
MTLIQIYIYEDLITVHIQNILHWMELLLYSYFKTPIFKNSTSNGFRRRPSMGNWEEVGRTRIRLCIYLWSARLICDLCFYNRVPSSTNNLLLSRWNVSTKFVRNVSWRNAQEGGCETHASRERYLPSFRREQLSWAEVAVIQNVFL